MATKRTLNGVLLCVLGSVLVTGCATYDAHEVKAFLQTPRSPVSGTEYRLYPPDVIAISSRGVPEINGIMQRVRPDGKINLPLLGEIGVAGRTPGEVEGLLTKAARDYYQQVDATVTVAEYNSQRFYVFGQVAAPGPMPWTGCDTLLDALARSQPTLLAWPERIVVVRGAKPDQGGYATADNPRHKMTINLMAMIESGDMANNILLRPNDVIYVQPNPFAAVGLKLQQILFPTRPVLEAARVPATVEAAVNPGQ